MKIKHNGVIREMTVEELAEFKESAKERVEEITPNEKIERLSESIERITTFLKKLGLEV